MNNRDLDKIQVQVNPSMLHPGLDIWCTITRDLKMFNLNYGAKGDFIETEVTDFASEKRMEPFLRLPSPLIDPFLMSIHNYQTRKSPKPIDQNFAEGKLQATEKHLEDMQTIVKKLLKIS